MKSIRLVALLVGVIFVSACASTGVPQPKTCAMIGAGLGAVGGGVGGWQWADGDHHRDSEGVGIGLASVMAGGLIGYGVCALLYEEPAPPPKAEPSPPPPPPPAPPPPPPEVEPSPDPCAGVIRLRGVQFAFDRAEIMDESTVVLGVVAEQLSQCKDVAVRVDGHTDSVGAEEYNRTLSERRAEAVRRFLGDAGVDPDRLSARGLGESMPIATNETGEGRALNRRVELHPLD